MKKILLISVLLAAPLVAQNWELNPDTTFPEEFYMQDTVLIKPTEYPGLPRQIGLYLEKKWNAMIPQVSASVRYDLPRPHNVLRGNFDGNGKEDWAVMAIADNHRDLIVFFDGDLKKKDVLFKSDELGKKYSPIYKVYMYNKFIDFVDATKLNLLESKKATYNNAETLTYTDTVFLKFNHGGIESGWLDKPASLQYYEKGKWFHLSE